MYPFIYLLRGIVINMLLLLIFLRSILALLILSSKICIIVKCEDLFKMGRKFNILFYSHVKSCISYCFIILNNILFIFTL